jgi:hypothetical protein
MLIHVKFGETALAEAKRLNYFPVLASIKSSQEIRQVLGYSSFTLQIDVEELKNRLHEFLIDIEFFKPKVFLPVLLRENREPNWHVLQYDQKTEDFLLIPYRFPESTSCIVCGINKATKKIYQDVSLRADYRPKYKDPLDREQITGTCDFCNTLSKKCRVKNRSVWGLTWKNMIESYSQLIRNNIFGLLAYTIPAERPRQYIFLPLPKQTNIYQEAKAFKAIYDHLLSGDFGMDLRKWCADLREIEYSHVALALIDRCQNIEEFENLIVYMQTKRAKVWSLEKIIEMRRPILRILRFISSERKQEISAKRKESRLLNSVVMSLTDNKLIDYYALLGTESEGGSLITTLLDSTRYKSPTKFLEAEKILLALSEYN